MTDYEGLLREAIEVGKASNHGRTKRGLVRKGCNLKVIHGCYWCRLEYFVREGKWPS